MQTLCTFFQTDNHAGTSSHNFKGEMLFLALNRFKALKAISLRDMTRIILASSHPKAE